MVSFQKASLPVIFEGAKFQHSRNHRFTNICPAKSFLPQSPPHESLLLTWLHFNSAWIIYHVHSHMWAIINDPSQTSTAAPLQFGSGWVISLTRYNGCNYLTKLRYTIHFIHRYIYMSIVPLWHTWRIIYIEMFPFFHNRNLFAAYTCLWVYRMGCNTWQVTA